MTPFIRVTPCQDSILIFSLISFILYRNQHQSAQCYFSKIENSIAHSGATRKQIVQGDTAPAVGNRGSLHRQHPEVNVTYPAVGGCCLLEVEEQRPNHAEKKTKQGAKHSPNSQSSETQPEQDTIPIQGQWYLEHADGPESKKHKLGGILCPSVPNISAWMRQAISCKQRNLGTAGVSQQPESWMKAPEAESRISCVGHASSSAPRGCETCDCISAG